MISAKTSLYCLVGDPVEHSLSPAIMNAAFAEHGCDAVYAAFRVDKSHAGEAIEGMRALGVAGANATYPLKEPAAALADTRAAAVETIGAANVLQIAGGRVHAENTDARGTVRALGEFGGVDPAGASVVIFGAGGAARAAAFGLLEAGAGGVVFAVRDKTRASRAVRGLAAHFSAGRIDVVTVAEAGAGNGRSVLAEADVVINATPAGMTGFGARIPALEAGWMREGQCCFDFVYDPRETPFLSRARERGLRTVPGLALLVAQAQVAFEIWTGKTFSLRAMFDSLAASGGTDGR